MFFLPPFLLFLWEKVIIFVLGYCLCAVELRERRELVVSRRRGLTFSRGCGRDSVDIRSELFETPLRDFVAFLECGQNFGCPKVTVLISIVTPETSTDL